MIFVSYYTKHTPYEIVINRHLLPSLKKWNLSYHIEGIDSLGNWYNNTAFKAKFILAMLEKYKHDVCFLDADAEIWKYPDLLFNIPNDYNIACHRLDWYKFWRNQDGNPKRELLSGTLVFKYNKKAIELAKKYIEVCSENTGKWEQRILQEIIESDSSYKVYDLPISYCAIKKRNGCIPKYIKDPVIVHYQASRQYKNKP